jgi:hypothetical protein
MTDADQTPPEGERALTQQRWPTLADCAGEVRRITFAFNLGDTRRVTLFELAQRIETLSVAAPAPPAAGGLDEATELAEAVAGLLSACGMPTNLCGVNQAFGGQSAIEILRYATKLKLKAAAVEAARPAPEGVCKFCGVLRGKPHKWECPTNRERATPRGPAGDGT